ncbi:MAG: hypothetical protein DMF72_11225 [Acidobacteria bacterium]|nr:MAG: hypothetical protein DMF72_11225 [Acidobacteriota bacterium]
MAREFDVTFRKSNHIRWTGKSDRGKLRVERPKGAAEMPTARKATKQGRAKKTSTQTSKTKASGTRVGTIEDWREGGRKRSTARRKQLRDGS